ncbi:error-prone DNA polymerase [Paucibacter sp. APW11]|uniref:Error-prone DNA polymerase n=1 Tax=Roseateles aquae TaxID=3077235 RepID=A0ABU3PDF2_9BURK|nr:error-prone DNA polymerase [Paucibacter sp. APW11]MDT9000335.1 error-prone DNA polymerase [Paucibacter sp. APW11]
MSSFSQGFDASLPPGGRRPGRGGSGAPAAAPPHLGSRGPVAYAELHCLSNFSFLRGASDPEELVLRAQALGYAALALTDECSLAGVVRAHVALKKMVAALRESHPELDPELDVLHLIIGSEFLVRADAEDEEAADAAGTDEGAPLFKLLLLAQHREGYGNLSQFITDLRRASPVKGRYRLPWSLLQQAGIAERLAGCLLILVPQRQHSDAALLAQTRWLQQHFAGRAWIGVELLRELSDELWLQRLRQLVATVNAQARATQSAQAPCELRLVACGDVHFHVRSRKPLQDVMTATRLAKPIRDCGLDLQPNAERHLRSRLRLAQIYPAELLDETLALASQCHFSLDELRYQYPSEVVPAGETPASYLRRLTYEGMARRWPEDGGAAWVERVEHELALISELRYEHYFLTVADVVRFAREQGILCQGRGSAANSVVCYCLFITAVNPAESTLLFERFISRERQEPPDIDVDFEHERREQVIQYLYQRYGRHRAALTGVVIAYRARSALRDVGRALAFDEALLERLAKDHSGWSEEILPPDRLQQLQQQHGFDADDAQLRRLIALSRQLMGMPRHLSQHVGGFVLTEGPLSRLVPIENATMPGRTVIEWDKDDLDALNLLKVDVLALGMLTALRRCLDMVNRLRGSQLDLAAIPRDDAPTYDMICAADTVGTFQIESRAQMSMLPRLKPRNYYDLVIEVAIVRPGPIEGGMVHPYLENRAKHPDDVVYPSEALKAALKRTCGIPIFQEQVMQVAMIAAGFTPGEADQLRRAMAAWKRPGDLGKFHDKILTGMRERGYQDAFAESIFKQIKGFASYGFPESHAASFALLTYISCWLKRHEPAAFLCALLNSQPLGFYTPSQLVQDARRHGVEVLSADVSLSALDSTLSPEQLGDDAALDQPAVRLGLRLVHGLQDAAAERIVAARREAPFRNAQDLALRAGLDQHEMQLLAAADALTSLAGHRRQQVWQASALRRLPPLLHGSLPAEDELELPAAPEGEEVLWDYASLGLTLRSHPLALLRPRLRQRGLKNAAELQHWPHGRQARACGIITVRQRPQTAKGTLFISLEDETGSVQVIVWPDVYAAHRSTILAARLLAVQGVWQHQNGVRHLLARGFEDLSPLLGRLMMVSRDFR